MSDGNWQGTIIGMLILGIWSILFTLIFNAPGCQAVEKCLNNTSAYCNQIIQNQYPVDRKE